MKMNIPLKQQPLAQVIGHRALASGNTCCKRNGVEGPFGVLVHTVKAEDLVRFQKGVVVIPQGQMQRIIQTTSGTIGLLEMLNDAI